MSNMSLNVRFIRGQWTSLTRPYRVSRRAWIETGILDLVAGFVLAAVYFLPFSNKSAGFTMALAVGILIFCGLADRKKKARMLAPSLTMGIVLGAVVAVGLCAFAWWAIHAHLTL